MPGSNPLSALGRKLARSKSRKRVKKKANKKATAAATATAADKDVVVQPHRNDNNNNNNKSLAPSLNRDSTERTLVEGGDSFKSEASSSAATTTAAAAAAGQPSSLSSLSLDELDLNADIPQSSNHSRNRARSRTRPNLPKRSSLKDSSSSSATGEGGGSNNNKNGRHRRRGNRRCASVNFCEQLEVNDIVPAKDLVDGQKSSLWWQSTEYAKIVELSCAIVDLSKVDKTTYTRGLEDLIKTDHADTFQTRKDVLMAQRILRQRQVQDDEALSGLYHASTLKYSQEAEQRGLQDAREVEKYLADTRRMCRRTWSV